MTSCDPAPRDIWLAYVEFADHEGVGKVRPVVILDASGKASVITAKVTTSANYGLSDFVEISDWESCGLRRPSWVQVEPLVEVRRDKLLRDEPLGQLSLSTYELVCAALGSVNQHPLPEPDKPLPGAMRRGEEGSCVRLRACHSLRRTRFRQPNTKSSRRTVDLRDDTLAIRYPRGVYGRWPMPPSNVRVSPLMNLKSGLASCTTTRPISVSTLP